MTLLEAHAEIDDETPPGKIRVTCDYRAKTLIDNVSGSKWNDKLHSYLIPRSWTACLSLRAEFGKALTLGPELRAWAKSEGATKQLLRDLRSVHSLSDSPIKLAADTVHGLYEYQQINGLAIGIAEQMLLLDGTGTGKTWSALAGIDELDDPFPVCIVAPKSMLRVWRYEIERFFGIEAGQINVVDGTPTQIKRALEPGANWYIIGWDAMRKHTRLASYGSVSLSAAEKTEGPLNTLGFRTFIADECVTHDSTVETPHGLKAISTVQPGDLVLSVDHSTGETVWAEVNGVMRSPLRETVNIGGVEMSANHPVWVDDADDSLYEVPYAESEERPEGLRVVRGRVPGLEGSAILHQDVQQPGDSTPTGAARALASVDAQGHSDARDAGEAQRSSAWAEQSVQGPSSLSPSARNAASERVLDAQRGERHGAYCAAADVADSVGRGLGSGARREHAPATDGLALPLQDRSGTAHSDAGDRGQRRITSQQDSASPRREEAWLSGSAWLDGADVLERRDPERSLWNIETSTGNYFVGGVLTHNCHRAKSPSTKRTRAAWAVAHGCQYRIGLTGSPIQDTVEDLYGPMHMISPEEYPTKAAWNRYCLIEWNEWGGRDVIGIKPDKVDEFYANFDARTRRTTKEIAAPWLPPKIFEIRWVQLSTAQRKAYNQMRKDYIADLTDGSVVTAGNQLVKAGHLTRMANGTVVADPLDPDKTQLIESPKVDQFINDLMEGDFGDEQIVVFSDGLDVLDLTEAQLEAKGITWTRIDGSVTGADRDEAMRAFQAGEKRICLLTKAGGEGITLTAGSVMVRLMRSWSYIVHTQVEDRVHRIGSEIHEAVTYVDYCTEGTIEEGQLIRLNSKEARERETLRDGELLAMLMKDGT